MYAVKIPIQQVAKHILSNHIPCQNKLSKIRFFGSSACHKVAYKRITVQESDGIREFLTSEGFKPRNSPTLLRLPKVSLPDNFVEYAKRVLQHEDLSQLEEGAKELTSHLRYRQPPIEEDEYRTKAAKIEEEIKEKDSFLEPFLSEEQMTRLEEARDFKIKKELKRTIYHWEPIKYDHATALHYLIGRTPAEFASLSRVFNEIVQRDPSFAPATMMDFGSGTGSVLWAAQKFWTSSLIEHMCVDASREMNDIAELLTRRGQASRQPVFPGVYFRQFLPVGRERKYDLMVSSYSLLELPSAESRMEILENLWNKTRKYFVLLEPGSNAGFEVINEARDFILQTYGNETETDGGKIIGGGHAFGPCPHDSICPRYATDTTPCNFHIRYRPLLPFDKDMTRSEVFSYLILKKGSRKKSVQEWPRLVRDPLVRGKHIICRLCTKDGDLAETILTKKKHLRPLCINARRSSCGDFLPVVEVQQQDMTAAEGDHTTLEEEYSE